VKPLGTGVWNEDRVFAVPALQGGWFAAPDNRGYNAFAGRYRARFGTDPTRIATLSYDAVSLAAALARTQGSLRYAEEVLTNPSGFAGATACSASARTAPTTAPSPCRRSAPADRSW
jgi:hypothetical protein